MARACFYCGANSVADDHAIPLWVPPLVGLADQPVVHMLADEPPPREPQGPADQIPFSIPAHAELGDAQPAARLNEAIDAAITERTQLAVAEYSARTLCASCAGTLAELDAQAMPLLEPMIESQGRVYDAGEQRVLAAWGARTAYSILAVERKSQGVPKAHRRALRERGEPHGDVYVGYGRYRANHIGVLAARLVARLGDDDETGDVEGYSVLAVFGHLALKVFGVHRVTEQTRIRSPQGQIVRVWPPADEGAAWPPIWSLTEQTLEQAFSHEPFYRPYRYSEVRYLGPGVEIPVKRRRTEGPGPRM